GGNRRALTRFQDRFRRDPAVASIAPPRTARDGRSALLEVTPRSDPESPRSRGLVQRLRSPHDNPLASVADVAVGGSTAHVEGFKNLASGSIWKILVFVLA